VNLEGEPVRIKGMQIAHHLIVLVTSKVLEIIESIAVGQFLVVDG